MSPAMVGVATTLSSPDLGCFTEQRLDVTSPYPATRPARGHAGLLWSLTAAEAEAPVLWLSDMQS